MRIDRINGFFAAPQMAFHRGAQQNGQTSIRRDTAFFSGPRARKGKDNPLQALMDQKQFLEDQKKSLLDDSRKNGTDVSERIKKINEQMETLDEQIREQALVLAQKRAEGEQEEKEKEPKTEQQRQARQFSDLVSFHSDIEQTQSLSSVKRKIDGKLKTMSTELESDQALAATLQARSDGLEARIGEKIAQSIGKLQGSPDKSGQEGVLGRISEGQESKEGQESEKGKASQEMQTEA